MSVEYFPREQWYLVATAEELAAGPVARTICDERVVIFRGADGMPGILADRCPHRMAPLSSGEVVGNDIACGYHGIRFGRDGACTHIPGDAHIPSGFAATSWPAIERHRFIYMWIGDGAPDESRLPEFWENDDPAWRPVPGYLHVAGGYQLMVDNILDLTHVVFVHKTTLAGGGVTETPLQVETAGERVSARRMMFDVDTAPIYRAAKGLNGKIDRWQMMDWQAPSYVKISVGARAAGDLSVPEGTPTHRVLNAFTPETRSSTHYFWTTSRPWGLDDQRVDAVYRDMSDFAFAEDAAIVARQQALIDSAPPDERLMAFPFDRAGVAARRVLARLMAGQG